MAIGVLAQLTQQAHENVTREQNFRSALFQQASNNIFKSQEIRIAEQNSINTSVSNMIRGQESALLKQQNEERLQMQTDSLIANRVAQQKDASARTRLAQEIAASKQAGVDTANARTAQIDATISDALRSKGFGVGGVGASSGQVGPNGQPLPNTTGFDGNIGGGLLLQDQGTSGLGPTQAEIDAARGSPINNGAGSAPLPSRVPGDNRGPSVGLTGLIGGGQPIVRSIPGALPEEGIRSTIDGGSPPIDGSTLLPQSLDPQTLVPTPVPDQAPVPAPVDSTGGITDADIIAASDTRSEEARAANNAQTAKQVVEREPVGQKNREVIIKSPGVDPEATAEQARSAVNRAGVKDNPVPSFAFVNFPETTEQQQINQQQINSKNTELKWWEGLAKTAEEGSPGNRTIIQGEVFRLKGEIENMKSNNQLTGVVELNSADLDLVSDYNAALAQNPDFIEFTNTANGERIRRDTFIIKMANKGKGAIARLRDISADDLAGAVEKSIKDSTPVGGVNRTPRTPPKDPTKGRRGTPGPVVGSKLMDTVRETINQNQR